VSYPSTPVKLKPYLEDRKQKIEKILEKNNLEPNRYLQAMRLGICLFKLAVIEEIGNVNNCQKVDNRIRKNRK
jgi:hypothetical protein